MSIFLGVLALTLVAAGIVFSVVPPLPGPVLAYLALVATHFVGDAAQFSTFTFVIWAVFTVAALVADYMIPLAATKQFGGTNAGVWGGAIGSVVGIFIPYGIILGPLFGAIIGDLIGGNHLKAAFKSGFGSFIGFLVATIIKILVATIMGGLVVAKLGSTLVSLISARF